MLIFQDSADISVIALIWYLSWHFPCAFLCSLTYWCAGLCPTCCFSHGQACQRTSSNGKPAPAATAAWWQHSPGNIVFWGGRWTFLPGRPILAAVSIFFFFLPGLSCWRRCQLWPLSLFLLLLQWKQSSSRPCTCSETWSTASLGNPPNHVRFAIRVCRSPYKCPSAFSQYLSSSQVSACPVKICFRRTSFSSGYINFIVFKPCLDFGLTDDSSLSEVTDEMLAFFLTLFQALRVQMGVAFTGQIIHTFLSMFTRFVFLIIKAFTDCVIRVIVVHVDLSQQLVNCQVCMCAAGNSWQPVFCRRAARDVEWCRSSWKSCRWWYKSRVKPSSLSCPASSPSA